MAITATIENRATAYGAAAKVLGLAVNDYGWAFLPVGTYFAGRVLKTTTETIQIMSDEWGMVTYAWVVMPDLSVVKFPLGDGTSAAIDIDPEFKAVYEAMEATKEAIDKAITQAEYAVKNATPTLQRGKSALVFKGRKIKPGTEVQVFWVGTQRNKFSGAMETRAGVTMPDGSKVFCDAGNLQPLPTADEMAAFADAQKALAEAKAAKEDMKVAAQAMA